MMKKTFKYLVLPLLMLGLVGCGDNQTSSTTNEPIYVPSECDVSLNEAYIDIQTGETFQIEALYKGGTDTFGYVSSNEEVANVSSTGVVTGLTEGDCYIKVYNRYDYTYLRVHVRLAGSAATEGILDLILSDEKLNLFIGFDYKLGIETKIQGKVIEDALITGASSNSSIATYENGYIKAKSAGFAEITISAEYQGSTVSKKVEVTIIDVNRFATINFSQRELDVGSSIVLNCELKGYKDGMLTTLAGKDQFTFEINRPTNAQIISEAGNIKLLGLRKGVVTVTGKITYEGVTYSTSVDVRIRELYTVNYYVGSTLFASEIVRDGDLITLKDTPIEQGKLFFGWSSNGEMFDPNTEIIDHVNLTAKWLVESNNLASSYRSTVLNYTTGDEVEVLGGSKFIWNHMETPGLDLQINARGGQAMVGEEKVGIYYTVNLPLFQYSNYQAISFFIAAGNFSYGQLVFNDGVSTYKTDRLNGFDFSASRPDPAYHQVSIKDGKLYFDRVDIGVSVSNDVLVGNEKFSFKIFTPFSSVNGDGSYAYADGYMKMSGLYSHLELEE